jgi:hypothetical protein
MRNVLRMAAAAASVAVSISCGDVVRDGKSPSILTIESLAGRAGNEDGEFVNPVNSDVITNMRSPAPCSATAPCPTTFNDLGSVTLRLSPKDITGTAPSSNNAVTISRFRVTYRRADGRNTPGLDVPYPFDGAVTGTVFPGASTELAFELVRHSAKMEAPLVQLKFQPQIVTTITDVTFWGRDQVGNEISASGTIQINFGDFGDF